MENKIDLYTVLKLIDVFHFDDALVYLRTADTLETRPSAILTVRQAKERMDLRKVKVLHISPYFCCDEYEGLLLTVTEVPDV